MNTLSSSQKSEAVTPKPPRTIFGKTASQYRKGKVEGYVKKSAKLDKKNEKEGDRK